MKTLYGAVLIAACALSGWYGYVTGAGNIAEARAMILDQRATIANMGAAYAEMSEIAQRGAFRLNYCERGSAALIRGLGVQRERYEVTAYSLGTDPDDVDGITATGRSVHEGIAAADWHLLPPGTFVWIPSSDGGRWYEVQDKGGAVKGRVLDIYLDTVQDARIWGRKRLGVVIVKGGGRA